MKWLDYMGVPNDKEHRQITIESCLVDGYDPETKTIYEFYGDFWHGNPNLYKPDKLNIYCGKTMKELYDKTIQRENKLKSMGYKFITIWENDWKKIYKDIKNIK
jgi:G:T-mismatch repair DNA endonuclease (very short patch repair protein)